MGQLLTGKVNPLQRRLWRYVSTIRRGPFSISVTKPITPGIDLLLRIPALDTTAAMRMRNHGIPQVPGKYLPRHRSRYFEMKQCQAIHQGYVK